MHTEISFPNLGIYLKNVGKSIDLFGIEIAYYGIIIGTAILLGFWIAAREAKRTGQNPENYLDMGIIGVIAGIVGARLYYVIFSWDMYKDNLLDIFNLREGGLAIASDHFGFTKEQKNAGEEDFMLTPSGMPGAEERPALMWQFGVNEGKITAEQMCAYLSENPAKLFKLYPWKGALIPGSDADIVIWNPNTEWTMTAADHQSACDYCLLEGAEIEGRAEQVYLRGKLVAENGKIIEEKTGMYIRHGVE